VSSMIRFSKVDARWFDDC